MMINSPSSRNISESQPEESSTKTTQNANLGLKQEKPNHEYLEITSDSQLEEVAKQEGWNGSGTKKRPYIIRDYLFEKSTHNPSIFNETLTYFHYPYGGFSEFNLILKDISLYVKIQNNNFMHSILVSSSSNVEIIENNWINEFYSSNLFLYETDGAKIINNLFDGNNQYCEENPSVKPTPRVYARGDGIKIIHNIFEIDKGCHEIIQLAVAPTNGDDDAPPMEISYNWFKASDTAIEDHLFKMEIKNNDFDVGDFAVITNGGAARILNNNFISSQIGAQGQQNYTEPIRYISQFRFTRGGTQNEVQVCQLTVDSNYYSSWSSPDDNFDGIVDNPYNVCPESFELRYEYDMTPSTTKFPGYADYDPESPNQFSTINLIIGFTALFVTIAVAFQMYTKFTKTKPVFEGELTGKPAQFIKELFKSQTILYYTLVGQSRIENKNVEDEIKSAIPRDFLKLKFLFHPIKISITKLLYENLEFTSIEMKNILDISWNDYNTHASALEKKGYINIQNEFVKGVKRQVLRLEPKGIEEYKLITELMHLFLDNSTDYKSYIEAAQRRMDTIDRVLYPDT